MDSITQITLGAAVGEVVLGKKIGNKAMLWGGIAGTIPDLDIFANMVSDELSALAFHRAITHSFTFALAAPVVLGWLAHKVYDHEQAREWSNLKNLAIPWGSIFLLIVLGTIFMPIPPWEAVKIGFAVSAAVILFPFLALIRENLRSRPPTKANATWTEWSCLFFWAIFTHPLLDSCTTYGTQLFQPFWDYRVAFNNISVVDPLYTLPFLLCLIIAAILSRGSSWRKWVNYVGIGMSSAYLIFSMVNKVRVDRVFEQSLVEQGIRYDRFTVSPTIFNNVLWQGVAEGDTAYYHGMYSLLDKQKRIPRFQVIPKNHDLLDDFRDDRSVKILSWFSKGYYNVLERDDGKMQLNDLRFGSMSSDFQKETDYVFRFLLEKQDDGTLEVGQSREPPDDTGKAFRELWERIKGI